MWAGFAEADITPELGVELCGYGYYLERKAESVADPLYARAVVVERDGSTLVLIACDLVGLGWETVERVKQYLQLHRALAPSQVMLCSTHTHSGPATASIIGCGEIDQEYVAALPEKIIWAVDAAFHDMKPVTAAYHFIRDFEGIGFNRAFGDEGPVDSTIRGLALRREGASTVVLVNYACHPVTLGSASTAISADYPGQVVGELKRHGYDAMFLTGFAGDIDPLCNRTSWGSGNITTMREYGLRIATAVLAGLSAAIPLSTFELGFEEEAIELPLQVVTLDFLAEELDRAKASLSSNPGYSRVILVWTLELLKQTQKGALPETEAHPVQVLRIGDVVIVGFPGEPFTELGLKIKAAFPNLNVMTVGYANAVMRYIPTAEDIRHKGYAGYSSCRIYRRLPLQPGAGEKLAEATLGVIRRTVGDGA